MRKNWILILGVFMIGVSMVYILRMAPQTKGYLRVVKDEGQDVLDVKSWRYNYGYSPVSESPIAGGDYWGLWLFDSVSDPIPDQIGDHDLALTNSLCVSVDSPGLIGNNCLKMEGQYTEAPYCQYGRYNWTGSSPYEEYDEDTLWTFWFWYKADNKGNEGDNGLEVYFAPINNVFDLVNLTTGPYAADVYFYTDIGDTDDIDTNLQFDWSQWCLYMFTFDGDKARLYINNVLKWTSASLNPTGTILWYNINMTAGWWQTRGWLEQMGMLKGICADDTVRAYVYNNGAGVSLP